MPRFIRGYSTFETGQNADIDQVAEVLKDSEFQCNYGIYVKAEITNSNNVFVGLGSGITISTGYRLDAGEEIFIPFSGKVKAIYVIGDADNQAVSYLAV